MDKYFLRKFSLPCPATSELTQFLDSAYRGIIFSFSFSSLPSFSVCLLVCFDIVIGGWRFNTRLSCPLIKSSSSRRANYHSFSLSLSLTLSHTNRHTQTHTHTFTHTHIPTHTHLHTHTYTPTHTHIHTRPLPFNKESPDPLTPIPQQQQTNKNSPDPLTPSLPIPQQTTKKQTSPRSTSSDRVPDPPVVIEF